MTTSGSLLQAILAVQNETPALVKDKTNPAFRSKYLSLDALVDTIQPVLYQNKLVWTTLPVSDEHGQPALFYRLAHAETGEEISGTMPLLLTKQDPQAMGSAITYARRYSLCAVLNLVADDDDDDGNGAGASFGARPSATEPASEAQLKLLRDLITKHRPSEPVLKAMLADVQSGLDPSRDGWAKHLRKDQASRLIERFKAVES